MALPSKPPRYDSWAELVSSIRQGETGWRPYALQVGLTALGRTLNPDGVFGPVTEATVRLFQGDHGLNADGIVGPATQGMILTRLGTRTHERLPDVPDGLMRGFAQGEGANVLAATNWMVEGGVDCGCMQFRVFGPPYDMAALRRAFDPLASMVAAGKDFLERTDIFHSGTWVAKQGSRREELAKRIAVLAHNWPAGAKSYAATGGPTRPDEWATWVAFGTLFPDGTPVRTRRQWCEFYAMGGPHGEGSITRYVRDWN